ncbi:Epoxide hydrolase B [Cladobotryum mycophilum]|uniref:Epoxide hydrolase B n=1 Tax=Cladobotryum mycophilum TaxID=491253 RepID=A0ABR0T0W7_9HYPO
MHLFLFALFLLCPLLRTAVAIQASNFNVSDDFAEAHGCGLQCRDTLRQTNQIDLSTFGQDFDFGFYTTAANFSTSKPGDVLKVQPMDPNPLQVKGGTTVYRIQYTSRDIDGSLVPATAFIALPYTPAPSYNTSMDGKSKIRYPLAAYAHGTSGIYRGCAPSTSPSLYDYDSWQLLVERGYAVVATDYAGLGNNYTEHKYLSFPAQVNDIYYSVLAARKALDDGALFTNEWVAVGHSQGGGVVWKLSESDLIKNDKNYLGTVALAPAARVADMFLANTTAVARSGYLPLHAKALQRVEPSYQLTILGAVLHKRVAIADSAQLCFSALLGLSNDLEEKDIVSSDGFDEYKRKLLKWQAEMAPANGTKSSAPVLVLQGLDDTSVLPETTRLVYKSACNAGSKIYLREYPGLEHSPIIVAAAPEWLQWIDERFAAVVSSPLPTLAPVQHINTSILSIAYYDSAPNNTTAPVAILIHGFPYSIDSYVDTVPQLASQGYRVIVPSLRGYGATTFLSLTTPRSAEQAALGKDVIDLMDALGIKKAIFAGYDWGTVIVNVAAALWPDRCSGMVAANSYLIQNRQTAWTIAPPTTLATRWYFYVFLTAQGYSSLANDTKGWARTLWSKNSPDWIFTEAQLDAASLAFHNPDYVNIATNFYRNRLLYAPGDPAYAGLADRLDKLPVIKVPSVTLDPDQAIVFPATDGSATTKHFTGPRVHHIVKGCGENIPLEKPQVFVDAILEVARLGQHN